MNRLALYYRVEPERDRWVPGDRCIRPAVRRLLRGRRRASGVEKVFTNLCLGLDRLEIEYVTNLAFDRLGPGDRVAVLGRGRYSLEGYARSNPVVAGIGLMTHPSEWPTLCADYPVVRYLQHSSWANDVYRPFFGDRCVVWPVGIDTEAWSLSGLEKDIDFLVYDKVRWDRSRYLPTLVQPIRESLLRRGLRVAEVRYGHYTEGEYRSLLSRARAMIFLCEHESQGLAYQECLASGVPVLAWDQGWCLDPNRFVWGDPEIRASSVPYFDSRCGEKFTAFEDFESKLEEFLEKLNAAQLEPREFILENLTLKGCAKRLVEILEAAAPS